MALKYELNQPFLIANFYCFLRLVQTTESVSISESTSYTYSITVMYKKNNPPSKKINSPINIFLYIFILFRNHLTSCIMRYVKVEDRVKKAIIMLVVEDDNIITSNYLYSVFPGSIGLMFRDETSNVLVT